MLMNVVNYRQYLCSIRRYQSNHSRAIRIVDKTVPQETCASDRIFTKIKDCYNSL